jgi:hypothetical protein
VYGESGRGVVKVVKECRFDLVHIGNSLFAQNFRNIFVDDSLDNVG